MQKTTIRKVLVIVGLLTLAVSAYAASHTITLDSPATLNGKEVAAGQYDVKVSGENVILKRGSVEVATAKARLEDRGDAARFNTVVTKGNGSGVPAISEIQFEGKKKALVFDNSTQASNQR